MEEDLETIQKNIENAAGKVVHRTKAQREKQTKSSPENVRLREEAAAKSLRSAPGEMQFGNREEKDQE